MIFCATDGWWVTTDTGLTWSELILGALVPKARSVAVVGLQENLWALVAYGEDHKIYHSQYPGGEWVVAYDTYGNLARTSGTLLSPGDLQGFWPVQAASCSGLSRPGRPAPGSPSWTLKA